MGRALLHRGPDGQFDGYRLSAIRRNTLADKLGIKNGDVIHSVNGKSLNSMSAAMDAYQTLTSENEFSFEVTRRGEKLSLGYDVQ
jgi:general secretion pathway protein C